MMLQTLRNDIPFIADESQTEIGLYGLILRAHPSALGYFYTTVY
jgi:hypothetical protein